MRSRSIVLSPLFLSASAFFCACGGGSDACPPGDTCTAADAAPEGSVEEAGPRPQPKRDAGTRPPTGHDAGVDAYEGYDAGPEEEAGPLDAAVDAADAEPGPCVKGASPAKNGCVTDKDGVFVSPTGTDAVGSGTMAMPFQTISYAVANGGSSVIYVCGDAGAYTDYVALTTAVALYGGMSCKSKKWSYDAKAVPVVNASPAGGEGPVALAIAGPDPVVVEDMSFIALDANPYDSLSVAVFLDGASDVTFRRISATAGAGAAGDPGAPGGSWSTPAPGGNGATTAAGALAPACSAYCGSIAGAGGSATSAGGAPGGNGGPSISGGLGGDGLGGVYSSGVCSNGDNGASAPMGTGGVGGVDGHGGQDGTPGEVGEGGGGGAGGLLKGAGNSGGAGSGACGGCPGGAGAGGSPGGPSAALLVANSTVTLEDCTVTAHDGGSGGSGGPGGAGQAGGAPANPRGDGCSGGFGGSGGQAGGGGGGSGGLSAGIAYRGTPPKVSGLKATFGLPGQGGAAGSGGYPPATAGSDGLAGAIVPF